MMELVVVINRHIISIEWKKMFNSLLLSRKLPRKYKMHDSEANVLARSTDTTTIFIFSVQKKKIKIFKESLFIFCLRQ